MQRIDIGGTHINYYMHCKRQLWYYINKINMEKQSEFVSIAKTEHNDSFKQEKLREIQIDGNKVDFIRQNQVKEIKTSKHPQKGHQYQLLYYMYFLNTNYDTKITKGTIHYININKIEEVEYTVATKETIEQIINEILKISEEQYNIFPLLSDKRCECCSFYDLCYVGGE